jgi:hypothetical protein
MAIFDGYKEKSLDERLQLEHQVENLKTKLEKCKFSLFLAIFIDR